MQAKWIAHGAIYAVLFGVSGATADDLSTVARELKASGAAAQVAACPLHHRSELKVGFFSSNETCARPRMAVTKQIGPVSGALASGPWSGTPFGKTDVFGQNTAFSQTDRFGQNAFFGIKN